MEPINETEEDDLKMIIEEIAERAKVGKSIVELKEWTDWIQDYVQDCYGERLRKYKEEEEDD